MNQTDQRDQFEDEIELIDYLRVLWKWKWLIIGGTLLCILAAAIYGFTRPVVKMYKVSALIEIDPEAKLDSPDKIKSMIEYGIFNQQIEKELSDLQGISNPESLAFEVAIPEGLNMLDIAYKTPNPDLGEAVLNTLTKQLEQEYKERLDQARYQFDETIKKKSESIKNILANIQIIEKEFEKNKITKEDAIIKHRENIKRLRENIKIVKNVIDEMKNALQKAQLTSEGLTAQREAIVLDSQDKTGHVDVFMQAAAIQQVINYPIVLMGQIRSVSFEEKELSIKILSESQKIRDLEAQIQLIELKADQNISDQENKIAALESEIETLERDRDKIKGVILKQPPNASFLPIKYKAKRNTILAGVVGFFFSIFLAFFIEYIKNASKRTQKAV